MCVLGSWDSQSASTGLGLDRNGREAPVLSAKQFMRLSSPGNMAITLYFKGVIGTDVSYLSFLES